MTFECIRYAKQDGVAVVRLHRPQVLNAMNRPMWVELQAALVDAQADAAVKALIVTGEGRAFSTGADLKESKTRSLEDYRLYLEELQEGTRRLLRLPLPTIAAINGYALGSGYELALACDIRIAAESALIGSPEARVASSVTGGALRLVQDLVGPGKAAELLFTAEPIDGREAARIGLVNRSVPLEALMPAARAMASRMANNSRFSLKLIKRGLRMARDGVSLEALMDYEIEACLACVSTRERQSALQTFAARKTER